MSEKPNINYTFPPESEKSSSSSSGYTFAPDSPYADLTVAKMLKDIRFDPTALHPFGLNNESVQYLFKPKEKTWDERIWGHTGMAYAVGLSLGGGYGFVEGIRKKIVLDSWRLRLNTVLNSVTRQGPFLGNSFGVLAAFYNIMDGAITKVRGTQDDYNTFIAAGLAGTLFRLSAGPKLAVIAGVVCSSVAGAILYGYRWYQSKPLGRVHSQYA